MISVYGKWGHSNGSGQQSWAQDDLRLMNKKSHLREVLITFRIWDSKIYHQVILTLFFCCPERRGRYKYCAEVDLGTTRGGFGPHFQHSGEGEAGKLRRQQTLPDSHQQWAQNNSIRLEKVSKQETLKSVLVKFFQAIHFSECSFVHSQQHHCTPPGSLQQAAQPLGPCMQPGPPPALSDSAALPVPFCKHWSTTQLSGYWARAPTSLRHRTLEALSRNRRGCQWKERSATSFSLSHPVGTKAEHALALECIELICTIAAHYHFMVLYSHCSWGALKQHTCSSTICTFTDNYKSTGVSAPYCSH